MKRAGGGGQGRAWGGGARGKTGGGGVGMGSLNDCLLDRLVV